MRETVLGFLHQKVDPYSLTREIPFFIKTIEITIRISLQTEPILIGKN